MLYLYLVFTIPDISSKWDSTEQREAVFTALQGKILSTHCSWSASRRWIRNGRLTFWALLNVTFWALLNVLQPAYNIGGRMVSIEAIQSYILRIRMPRPGQVRLITYRVISELQIVSDTVLKFSCFLFVVAEVITNSKKVQNRRWTSRIFPRPLRASLVLCSLFGQPFWSSGK